MKPPIKEIGLLVKEQLLQRKKEIEDALARVDLVLAAMTGPLKQGVVSSLILSFIQSKPMAHATSIREMLLFTGFTEKQIRKSLSYLKNHKTLDFKVVQLTRDDWTWAEKEIG